MTVPYRERSSAIHRAELRFGGTGGRSVPLSAFLEISDRCNEVCVHCYQVQGQKGELSTADVKAVLDDLARQGVLFLTLSGGEVTLRHDFLDLVAHARTRRFAVKIYTNGLTMTRELAEALASLAVQEVQISLYSHRAEVHDWITGVSGSWERTVTGIRHLVAAKVPVVAKSPLFSFTEGEYDPYLAFVRGLGADFMLDPGSLFAREDGDRAPQAFDAGVDVVRRISADPRLMTPRPQGETPAVPLSARLCGAAATSIHMEPNGEFHPCGLLDVRLGSATEGGVAALAADPEASFIRSLTWAEIHGCRDCDLRAYCSRCFAKAGSDGGDALGPYASACELARARYEVVHGARPAVAPGVGLDRDVALGPYRRDAGHGFTAIEDRLTAEDLERRAAHPWVVRARGAEKPTRAIPGQLVQLRRPPRGRKAENTIADARVPEPRQP